VRYQLIVSAATIVGVLVDVEDAEILLGLSGYVN
jgi:hypothetical protein